jgi:hypothetical protein
MLFYLIYCFFLFFALFDFFNILCYTKSAEFLILYRRYIFMATATTRRKTREEVRQEAERRLIASRRCALHPDDVHSVPSYGSDMNSLDCSRLWLFEEVTKTNSQNDYEYCRILANKQVLWLAPDELAEEIQKVIKELHLNPEDLENIHGQRIAIA